jgi:DNA-binding transcriptional LysR family regulator
MLFMVDVDLNLLRVFDTLFEERSVTRAAARLGLTQSAVSHALGRLRLALSDPLFVRGSAGLQPTARASAIASGIREGLLQLRGALSPSVFEPAGETRQFTISAGSYFCALLVPDLMTRARAEAPGVGFRILAPEPGLLAALDEGAVDLALGAFGKVPARLSRETLYHEESVWIASAANVRAAAGAVEDMPRLEIAGGTPIRRPSTFVSEGGLERLVASPDSVALGSNEVRLAVYDALTATAVVGSSDLVALVPRRIAIRNRDPDRLALLKRAGDGVEIEMLWHGKSGDDAGLAWLLGLIRGVSREISARED